MPSLLSTIARYCTLDDRTSICQLYGISTPENPSDALRCFPLRQHEPTNCRLRARDLPCSAVLDIALSCLFLECYGNVPNEAECRDYPVLPAFFKHIPYKSPYSVFGHFSARETMPWKARRRLACRCQLSRWASRICRFPNFRAAAPPLYGPYRDARLQMQPVGIAQQLLDAHLGDSTLEQAAH